MILLLLAPFIALALVGVAAVVLQAQRSRQTQLIGRVVDGGEMLDSGSSPTLLYFTGAACAVCHAAQRLRPPGKPFAGLGNGADTPLRLERREATMSRARHKT